ncbi:AMIN-like domain-containing (lipo)protein [Saccharothrix xinjiangensis]
MRKIALLVSAVLGLALAAPAASAAPAACAPVDWGSGDKQLFESQAPHMTDLRAGRHECYDRLVFDISGAPGGYAARYVPEIVQDPSGNPIPVRGGAGLQVTTYSATYDENFDPTYEYDDPMELVDVTGYATFRQVVMAGSWEGTTTIGLGVRARLPFRVLMLPDRLVVDVAHTW